VEHGYVCPICPARLTGAGDTVEHLRAHRYQCPLCKEMFTGMETLIEHVEIVHLQHVKEPSEEEVLKAFVASLAKLS